MESNKHKIKTSNSCRSNNCFHVHVLLSDLAMSLYSCYMYFDVLTIASFYYSPAIVLWYLRLKFQR